MGGLCLGKRDLTADSGTGGSGRWLPSLVVLASLALFLALAAARPSLQVLWGDEGTYVAMAASLARDGDLAFDDRDARWCRERQPERPVTVILQRTSSGIAYSKPPLYPLIAAPFYALAGERGMVGCNLLLLLAALLPAWQRLRGLGAAPHAALTLAVFLFASVTLPYVGWRMSEVLQFSLCLAGLALAMGPGSRGDGEGGSLLPRLAGGLLLGLLASMRLPNLALAAAPVIWHLIARRWRRAAAVALAAIVGFSLAAGSSKLLTGAVDPYRATRSSFNESSGYPAGADAEEAGAYFFARPAAHHPSLTPRIQPREMLYSGLYLLVGRHTGLVLYFPASLALLLSIVSRPGRRGAVLLGAAAAMCLFYLLWMPGNYFGGSTFLGNRYFLVAYPALLVALQVLPRRRLLVSAWLLGAAVGVSALVSSLEFGAGPLSSQSHTRAGLFRLMPFETTAEQVDGLRSRDWLGDRLRFVDPFARVGDRWFSLSSQRAPAEVELATSWRGDKMRVLVESDRPGAELVVKDWARVSRYPLGRGADPGRQILELVLSPAWRRHPVSSIGEGALPVRTLRLGLDSSDGSRAVAKLQYLGDPSILDRDAFDREVLRARLPRTAVAGSIGKIPVRVRNLSRAGWATTPLIPVHLSYRLLPEGAEEPIDGRRTPLPRRVRPGEILATEVRIAWPQRPGRYFLRVDLVQENVAWFEEKVGRPLARRWVEVIAGAEARTSPAAGPPG